MHLHSQLPISRSMFQILYHLQEGIFLMPTSDVAMEDSEQKPLLSQGQNLNYRDKWTMDLIREPPQCQFGKFYNAWTIVVLPTSNAKYTWFFLFQLRVLCSFYPYSTIEYWVCIWWWVANKCFLSSTCFPHIPQKCHSGLWSKMI